MSYIAYLQKTIDYIEENLKEPLSIDDCAREAGFSKFHFHRLFGIYVGVPVMEYIRKRRLYNAMMDVCNGKKIIDIAVEYGYSSERTFRRAFQQEFGQIPSSCRNAKYAIPSKPVLTELLNQLYGGITMEYLSEVRIDSLDAMTVASAIRISSNPEDEVITFMSQWAEQNGIGANSRSFGFDVPVTEEEQKKGFRGYEYWITTKENVTLAEGVSLKQIEGCKYAILRITEPFVDPFERIPAGWRTLAGWVNSRGYKASCDKERYWLEEKIEIDGKTYMDVYFPIE